MGKKIRLIFIIFFTCLFIPIQFNGQSNKQRTEAGKVREKALQKLREPGKNRRLKEFCAN